MSTYQHTAGYFEVAKRLLEAPEFSLGGRAIARSFSLVTTQDVPPASFPPAFAWFVLETRPLKAPATRESLLLFADPPSPEAIRDAWKLSTDSGNCSHLVCVVPEGAEELVNGSPEGVAIWTAKSLFERILRLPSDFPAHLR